ncbi:MAG: hypothetical protein Q7N50_00590 [Armatimonadota bacterium]|nr:hypothetical protein [Armatimonadota bacterium]
MESGKSKNTSIILNRLAKLWPVAIPVLLALALRIAYFAQVHDSPIFKVPTMDAWYYDGMAQSYAWFVCFAPVENPQIAICVFREAAGHGGSEAGPVARAMLEEWFQIKNARVERSGRTD